MNPAAGNNKVAHNLAGAIGPLEALNALGEIVQVAREYGQLAQTERTRRAAIAAAESVQVARIEAAEATLKMYFDRVFAERRQSSDAMFVRLDQAMEAGDPQMVHAVVRGIVELAQSSPLAGLDDFGKFWAEYGTPDNPIEL
ncbi:MULTISPECIES: hypothetical protein [Dietzia]|uniref:Uncharacterized protein n=1 Tax=Dietzia cercidiphylli TaxID=498199 RepID=A0ABN2I592_9ACTN|nr:MULTISPECIES: hypothetical protein [Dietzia]